MNDDKLSLTIPAAIAATGIGRTKLYEHMKRGDVIALKCGKRTLITAASLKAFIQGLPKANAA